MLFVRCRFRHQKFEQRKLRLLPRRTAEKRSMYRRTESEQFLTWTLYSDASENDFLSSCDDQFRVNKFSLFGFVGSLGRVLNRIVCVFVCESKLAQAFGAQIRPRFYVPDDLEPSSTTGSQARLDSDLQRNGSIPNSSDTSE